jgi:hypothetical protein
LIVKKIKTISIDDLATLSQKNGDIWNVAVTTYKNDKEFWDSIIRHRVSFLFDYNIKQLPEEIQMHICTQDNMHHVIMHLDSENSTKLLYFIEKNNIQIREKDRQYLLSLIILHLPKNKNIVETFVKKLKTLEYTDFNRNANENLSLQDIQKQILYIIQNIPNTYTQSKNFSLQLLKAYLEDPTYVSECVECIQQLLQIEQQPQEHIQKIVGENTTDIKKTQEITLQEVIIDLFITIDPTVGELFNNPQKLGKIKDILIKNIIFYVQELVQQGVDFALLKKEVSTKLQNIKRIFESSNTPDSKKRALFLDQFDLSTCQCSQVSPYVFDAKKMKEIATNDVVDILTQSGSNKEHVPKEKTREAQERKKRRSEENRRIVRAISKKEESSVALLPDNALTHGSRSEYLGLMLSQGNFSGELLGVSGKSDRSGALGVDLSKVDNNEITFEKRYKKLSNGQYGDIVFVYGQYDNKERPPYHSGVIGGDHYLVRSGISSVEITTIIIRDNTQGNILTNVKKEIAANGMFIPVVDTHGNILFTEQEYDDMKAVYETMHRKGYDFSLIDTVYDFYIHKKGNEKQQIVLSRIIEELKQGNDVSIDLVILVSFFQGNDLNMKPSIMVSNSNPYTR